MHLAGAKEDAPERGVSVRVLEAAREVLRRIFAVELEHCADEIVEESESEEGSSVVLFTR